MKRNAFLCILLVVLFLLPMSNPTTGSDLPSEVLSSLVPDNGDYFVSQDNDPSIGTGNPLDVIMNGIVSNVGAESMSITSSRTGVSSVTITDGWTGSNLQAEIDTLSWRAEDVLDNGNLNLYHNELFIVTSTSSDNDDVVQVPDKWTIIKDVVDDNAHPQHGVYELDSDPNGDGSRGVYLNAEFSSSYDAVSTDEIYLSQLVSMPYRELYSAQISFRYRVSSSSNLDNMLHLFVRFGDYTTKFHVFESGDTTDTWLTASVTIPASSMSDVSTHALLFDIGLATDATGTQSSSTYVYAYIDEIQLDMVIRPFPEQINLNANRTLVWGYTSGSIYPYVPDGANRDCYDTPSAGIDLDGFGNDGGLGVGIYDGSGYYIASMFQAGLQFPLDIPDGAIVTSAYLEVEAMLGSNPGLGGMRVYIAQEDNVGAFTTGLPTLEDRYDWLETSVDWSLDSWVTSPVTRYRSPDMAAQIQRVISRSGWSSGNYIALMLDMMYANYYQRWNDVKGTAGFDNQNRARLMVEYIIPEPEDHVVSFNYQKDITIDHNDVVSDLTNFPVMIDITDSDLRDHVLLNGDDIAFTINGVHVEHEIQLYDHYYSGTEAHLIAWVKVPNLSSGTDTVITMHYGSLDASSISGSEVWDDYAVVQHLDDDPTGIQYDSTANNFDGTSYGGLSTSNLVTGQVGSAIDFDGTDDVISVGQIDTNDWTQFSMSAWINHDVTGDDRIFSKAPSTAVSTCIMHMGITPTNYMRVRLYTDGTGGTVASSLDSSTTASIQAWHLLTWTWSATSATVFLYIDGQPAGSYSKDGDTIQNSDIMWIIANWETGTSDTRHFDGKIDEIRMRPSAVSAAWIETEYNNQYNPSGFYSVSTEESTVASWSDAGDTSLVFTTSSPTSVTIKVNLTMDITGIGQTLDENLDPGTSFFIESGSEIVNWTAKVMVSPPAGATSMGFDIAYPVAEWKPTTVMNPFNIVKSNPSDWTYQGGTLNIKASAIDFWGLWTIKFISWNYVQDLTLGITGEPLSTTATFNIGDSMKFLATTPTIQGANVGLILTDPTGSEWLSTSNTTTTDPNHRFPSFQYRKDIQIAPAVVYADVTDFPVALDFTDTDLHDTSKVRADGSDIMFAIGDTILPHEIEYFKQDYTVTDARFVGWVKANLSSSTTTTITMYYGSPLLDNLENPEAVWSNNFDAVWHLGEDVTDEGTTGIHYDSTGNGYDGVQNGNVETLISRVGYAQSFDGNDYITFSDALAPTGDVMITGWFRIPTTFSSTSTNTIVLMEKYLDEDTNMAIALVGTNYGQGTVPAGSLVLKIESLTYGAIYKWTTRTTWTANQWYYVGCYGNYDNPSGNQIFIGYSSADWDTDSGQVGSPSEANLDYIEEWHLGGGDFDTGATQGQGWVTGQMDEWRVASVTQARTTGWLQTEWRNQASPSSFAVVQTTEYSRTSPDHTFTQGLTSDAPAGVWTASVYYNDTGTSVSTRTGLYERTFTVKRDTYLELNKPTDAIGDRLSVKTAGDAVIVEFSLKDDLNDDPINGATVTMNWTTPSSITLDSYGGGKYGAVVDTNDLADAGRWRIEVASTHPYYNDANEYFDIDLYHNTGLDYSDVSTTPVGVDFTATVTFTDTYTGTPIEGAVITFNDDSPVQSYTDEGGGEYSVSIDSDALSLGLHTFTLKATSADGYQKIATVTITFTLRAHYTSVSVSGDFITPYGDTTEVTVVLIDLDTGFSVNIGSVTSFSFTSPGNDPDNFGSLSSFTQTLTTEDWAIGTHTVTLTVVMASTNFQTPSAYQFDITIRKHRTALTISGVSIQPYGNVTPLTIEFIDLDTGLDVPSSAASNFRFEWLVNHYDYPGGGSLSFDLDTSTWPVGSRPITVITTMNTGIYDAPSNYVFQITIRSMNSLMYLRPPASALYPSLVFPIGVDFEVYLQLNVSESGIYYGDPIAGRVAGEFSVPSYSIKSVDLSEQAIGRYKLTIDAAAFGDGTYEIIVHFNSNSALYEDTFIVIRFRYRPIISALSSPNYPQVITPYQMNVEIILNYTDADFGTGIEGATIDSTDHPSWIDNVTDLTGGLYSVWIDVSSLSQGTYYITLRADKALYDAKTLQFRIVIRVAYTSAVPSVGSLDIPLGSSVVFYVDYTDVDRLVPIDNATSPYTEVLCSWTNYHVEYLSGIQKYMVTFSTTDTDTIAQNVVYTFTFQKGANYQVVQFAISVSIRTHNTDFRLVSAIEPTSTIGIFNISVYYGDLDDAVGIKSALVIFSVHNASGLVMSGSDYDLVQGDGFYIIQVPASQFGLGLQTFTVYADWTGAYSKYQDKSFLTTANVVGRESALTLLIAAEPTPYLETMSYTFFFSDIYSSVGINNLTGNVFIYVSFQGETVGSTYIVISDLSSTQPGNYSIEIDTAGFSRIGLIYMDISVEWAKGVSPYYANRTDTISVRVLQRDTLLQVSPPSPTSYGEIAQFNFTYEDVTGGGSVPIGDDAKLTITLNVPFTYSETGGTFSIYIDTSYYASIGQKTLILGVTWDGIPFYANKTGRVVYLNVILRETFVEYLAPAPTQYLDEVVFNVTWTDITNGGNDPIAGATPTLYVGLIPIDGSKYSYVEVTPGVYEFTLNTTFAATPGTYSIRVGLSVGVTGISDVYVSRQFTVRTRITLLSAEPVDTVPYNSSIIVILYYQDLFTSGIIANESAEGYPATLQIISGDGSGWIYTAEWQPVFEYYILSIETYNQPYMTYTPYTLTLRMTYAYQSPFYASDDVIIEFELRNRETSLRLTTEPETTPYGDNAQFIVKYADLDASESGISGATIAVLNNSVPLVLNTHYTLSQGSPGFYIITVDSHFLGDLGPHSLTIQATWSGAPYYDSASRDVSILVRQRETNLDIIVPPSQTRYLDDVTFSFEYVDLDASVVITSISTSNVHLYFANGTEILSGFTVIQDGSTFEVTIPSTVLTSVPISGLSVTVMVDWDADTAPYYADDSTNVKVTITGRSLLFETDQIDRTPKGDTLTITVTLTDLDSGVPVEGAIILFSCQTETLVEGVNYDRTEGSGIYTFDVYTGTFPGFGVFKFDIEVQWNPNLAPYYSNRTVVTLNGLVDYVRTQLQAGTPNPVTVPISDSVWFNVTYTDLDHSILISGAEAILVANIHYYVSGLPPVGLSVVEYGTTGVYNISFSTSDITKTGSYSIVISAEWSIYGLATTTPSFSIVLINSALTPHETSLQLYWRETTRVIVNFTDITHDGLLISGATITYTLGSTSGNLYTNGTPGYYYVDIDSTDLNAGTRVMTITASLAKYTTSIASVTLVILTLPSEMIIVTPDTETLEVSRGDAISIQVRLNDTTYLELISNTAIDEVYITFRGVRYSMEWNAFDSTWDGTIPAGGPTILNPGAYDVRITGLSGNYDPAIGQFKVIIKQTTTKLTPQSTEDYVIDPENPRIEAVYSDIVVFNLTFTAPSINENIADAQVYWYESRFDNLTLYFVHMGNGVWQLTFNTSLGLYGTWGITFVGIPANTTLAETAISFTLTIKRISTEVEGPITVESYDWGYVGNITFYYNDISHEGIGIGNATVSYDYGPFTNLPAYDLGNGMYYVEIDTTYLESDSRQRIIVHFEKDNYEERDQGINIFVSLRSTTLDIISDEQNQIGGDASTLQIPMGDSFYVTFFYNDTSLIGGLSGGIGTAIITSNTIFAGTSFGGQRNLTLENLGGGYYRFYFDTMNSSLYTYYDGVPQIGERYFFTISLDFLNREPREVNLIINVIAVPTKYIIEQPLDLELVHGNEVLYRIYVNDTWHNQGVVGAKILVTADPAVRLLENDTEGDGWYYILFRANAVDGSGFVDITIELEYHESITLRLSVYSAPNDRDILIAQVTQIGLPISLVIITLLGLYVKVWSVPKRIRQINGQIKSLRKGKIPKPITDVKDRKQLIAELFNDTYEKLAITRLAEQMPEESIPIEVPEMGELLLQLAILTHLDADELEEFKADISKMKMSEQAAFVKEVIMQEAIRAARRDGTTVEATLDEIEKQAALRLRGDEEVEPIPVEKEEVETFLIESEAETEEEVEVKKPPKEKIEFDEEKVAKSEKMSPHEIDELRKDLERKGVPLHEIDTILQQARELPRDLVEELIRSLDKER